MKQLLQLRRYDIEVRNMLTITHTKSSHIRAARIFAKNGSDCFEHMLQHLPYGITQF